MGGIEKLIGADDIVVIKPNVQWWNQGAPNILALKTLVDIIMDRPGGFTGEVIVAENCHRGSTPWQSEASGWKPAFERNSDLPGIRNYNELGADLKRRHAERYTTCHWINVNTGASAYLALRTEPAMSTAMEPEGCPSLLSPMGSAVKNGARRS